MSSPTAHSRSNAQRPAARRCARRALRALAVTLGCRFRARVRSRDSLFSSTPLATRAQGRASLQKAQSIYAHPSSRIECGPLGSISGQSKGTIPIVPQPPRQRPVDRALHRANGLSNYLTFDPLCRYSLHCALVYAVKCKCKPGKCRNKPYDKEFGTHDRL